MEATQTQYVTPQKSPLYLTPREAATRLGVHVATVRNWALAGYIRYGLTMGGATRRGNYRYHAGDVARVHELITEKAV